MQYSITTRDFKGTTNTFEVTGDQLSILSDSTEFGALVVVTKSRKVVHAIPLSSFVEAKVVPPVKKSKVATKAKVMKLVKKK